MSPDATLNPRPTLTTPDNDAFPPIELADVPTQREATVAGRGEPTPAARPSPRHGGECEMHLDDGRVVHGTLSPTPLESASFQCWGGPSTGLLEARREQVRLLRLTSAPAALARPDVLGRSFRMELPGLSKVDLSAWRCTGTHAEPSGGIWLDVRRPDGAAEAWWLPPVTLPALAWVDDSRSGAVPTAPLTDLEGLWQTLQRPAQHRPLRLGEALQHQGLVRADAVTRALRTQAEDAQAGRPHRLLGHLLLEEGAIAPAALQQALIAWQGVPVVDLDRVPPEPEALALLPRSLIQRECVLPILSRDDTLVVAVPDPWDHGLLETLRFASERRIRPVAARAGTLAPAVARAMAPGGGKRALPASPTPEGATDTQRIVAPRSAHDLAQELAASPASEEEGTVVSESDNTLVRALNALIDEAVRLRASDIHLETGEPPRPVRVRLRVDGELMPYLELPSRLRFAVVARLKIMADLDIAEHRKPQDGKINFARFGGPKVELRVVTVPTQHGLEDVVLRLLGGLSSMPLDRIGLSPANLRNLRDAMTRPYGLILICGPTGCGKTTTLHSVMRELNTGTRKIWTAEDPVEITQEGLRQVQVNPRIGWTFAAAMRTFLRADPDVIMIGEMRDEETARIAVEASLTGHLVMSTLHTNSAPESITRLLEIGLDPYMFSDSLLAIMAQRLVRRLCTACRVPIVLDDRALHELAGLWRESAGGRGDDEATLVARWKAAALDGGGSVEGIDGGGTAGHGVRGWRRAGCARCDHTGYHGRLGLHELMRADERVRERIRRRAPASELQAAALDTGMITLRQDGIEKVLAGLTDLPEVLAASNT
jgi:type II secretory ATPase GspE/PulE/Tfp pilus assembly ATPase PilB-like protein